MSTVVAVPVDNRYGDPKRISIKNTDQLCCLLCPASAYAKYLHTTKCSECPATCDLINIAIVDKSLKEGKSTTCIVRHPHYRYPTLKDNVYFAGLYPLSLDGTIVVVQLQLVNGKLELRDLPSNIGIVNPALDYFRPIMLADGFDVQKKNLNGELVDAVPYNPKQPCTSDDNVEWYTLDGVKLPLSEDDHEDEDEDKEADV